MANIKNIEAKSIVVDEIKTSIENAKSVVMFDYRGLDVNEVTSLRRLLRDKGASYKVYKNTLTKRALDDLKINFDEYLEGPNAISFGIDDLSIVKVLSDFAKEHDKLELKAGIIDGKVVGLEELNQYASIPSREGLLTMLAGSMIAVVRDLSICLDLYSKEKEEN